MLVNSFSTSTCFAIFDLNKLLCLNIQLPAQRISQPAPSPHLHQVQPAPARAKFSLLRAGL